MEDALHIKDLDLKFGYHYEDIVFGTSNMEFQFNY